MTVDAWLQQHTTSLEVAGIGTARLDCLVLLEDMLKKERSWILAHPELELSPEQTKKLQKLVERRAKHEPLAYIRGKTEFYGREFLIDKIVLEPRPESETMIDLLKELDESLPTNKKPTIVDVGTGSGALAVTAAIELAGSKVLATDIDSGCLEVTGANIRKHKVNVQLLQGDLLEPVNEILNDSYLILANLPYVPNDYTVNEAAMHEPKQAIYGGPDGLDLYRRLFDQSAASKIRPAHVFTESLPFQHQTLAGIAESAGYQLLKVDDFIQLFQLQR